MNHEEYPKYIMSQRVAISAQFEMMMDGFFNSAISWGMRFNKDYLLLHPLNQEDISIHDNKLGYYRDMLTLKVINYMDWSV